MENFTFCVVSKLSIALMRPMQPTWKRSSTFSAAAGELLYDREHETQVAAYELLARGLVSGLGPPEQRLGLVVFEHRQLGRVHAAYLDLALQKPKPLFRKVQVVFPAKSILIQTLPPGPERAIIKDGENTFQKEISA